jgi:hypothetical protein
MTIALVETPAPNPMSAQDDHKTNGAVKMVSRGAVATDKGRSFGRAERWLHPADQLDYMIRRWMIPVPFEANRLIATGPFFRWSHEHSREASRSTRHAAPSRRGNGLLSQFRAVVGQFLRAKWEITQPIPARRVVRQFERRDGDSEW